jgi:hypothetical protein
MRTWGIIAVVLMCVVPAGVTPAAQGAETPDTQPAAIGQTPPRLSYTQGQVSFWRPGAQDWAQAQVNTPVAPGDELYTGSPGTLELQVGGRAFVRAWATTQVGLENQEPDFLQFKVTTGHASFDLRTLEPGRTVEVDTPNAAIIIEHTGYYRVAVTGERTSFIARRSGQAIVSPAGGAAVTVAPSEEVVIQGTADPQVTSYAAPPLDDWDRWNYARTDQLLDAVSARYVSPGMYGVDDLDLYGTWRVVPSYGPVWVPTAVPTGWVPYSTGSWMQDPYYGWTWVDSAPWGWAPFHYGRWVFVNGFWAWTPGPAAPRPVYAPALVAFYGGPDVQVGVGLGGPVVGWVALCWGEPLVPWWGPAGFIHRPWWGGWHGPRVVNDVVISNTSVVTVQSISLYRNAGVRSGVVVVSEGRFGHGPITSWRVTRVNAQDLQPIHTAPRLAATPGSFVPTATRGVRPPEQALRRPVVATRPPHHREGSASGAERSGGPPSFHSPAPHLVSRPPQEESAPAPPRAPFGQSTVERPTADRVQPSSPPAPKGQGRSGRGPASPPPTSHQGPAAQPQAPQAARPTPPVPQARTSPKTEESKRPAPALATPPAVTGQVPPEQHRVPQGARPTAPRPQASTPPKAEAAKRPTPEAASPPAATPKGPAAQPQAPQAAGPTPPVPQGPGHAVKAPRQPARGLPGEPASHLSPNRAETGKTSREGRRAPEPPAPPQGGSEKQPGGRGGG